MGSLQTLRPLTIRQIINATQAHTEAEFVADGTPITQVSMLLNKTTIVELTNLFSWVLFS
jgi:hypothetical protein